MKTTSIIMLVLSTLLPAIGCFAQFNPNGNTTGTITDSSGILKVDFEVTYSSTCSIMNFGHLTDCDIDFPDISSIWSGNSEGTTSTITYSFSEPINSVNIMIGVTGIYGSDVTESFRFTTDTDTPSLSVFSGSCGPWTINLNETTSPTENGAFTSVHTIYSKRAFTSVTISTESSGSGMGANGGSNFAICDGFVINESENNPDSKKYEAGG